MESWESYKSHYSVFLGQAGDRMHFAAHSHHFWPDVTEFAQQQCWRDAASLWDAKWAKVFGEVIPAAKAHLCWLLNLSDADTLAFAPNTHEFVVRILSAFPRGRGLRILTTDGEFHSFNRQITCYEALGNCSVKRVAIADSSTFAERWLAAVRSEPWDLIFTSHVFFSTGMVHPCLLETAQLADERSWIVIDGYHAVGAVPVDIRSIEDRVFYVGGGYKYLQAGEGACYLHVPPHCLENPSNTGWMASMDSLDEECAEIVYPSKGARFWGATFDPSGWYRFNAVMDWWRKRDLTVSRIADRTFQLQELFLSQVKSIRQPITLASPRHFLSRGSFLSFDVESASKASRWVEALGEAGVIVDSRARYLRFGFGLYHDPSDIALLVDRILSLPQSV